MGLIWTGLLTFLLSREQLLEGEYCKEDGAFCGLEIVLLGSGKRDLVYLFIMESRWPPQGVQFRTIKTDQR